MAAEAGGAAQGARPPGPPASPATDADRERFLALLREHYALGTLDDAELDRRTGIVLAARYVGEAAAALDGLPALAGPAEPGRGWRGRHRHAQAERPAPGWVPTSERFRDPVSSQIVRVWVDPADGSRHYVPEAPPA